MCFYAFYAVRKIVCDTQKKFAYVECLCYDIYINQKIDGQNTRKEMSWIFLLLLVKERLTTLM